MTGAVISRQGVGAVPDSLLNAFVQGTNVATDLLNTPGVPGMNVWVAGTRAVADGGQGFYHWEANATGPTNLPAVIVPVGSTGAWVFIPVGTGGVPGAGVVIAITYVIDSGGAGIIPGVAGQLYIPFNCTLTAATLLADETGDVVIDVWNAPLADYPPNSGNSITASDQPTISSAQSSQDTALIGWTTTVSAGDVLMFNVNSADGVARLTIALTATRL